MSVFEHETDDQISALHERLYAAEARTKELVRADQALRTTIEALAGDADLSSVVGRVLMTAGEQLEAPVVEYWTHDSDTVARLVMSCREGRIYDGSDFPNDPRVAGINIPSSMTGTDSLFKLRGHFFNDLAKDPVQRAVFDPLGLDLGAWCLERDVTTHLNVQLRFGDRSVGALASYFRSVQVLTDARIELAYALANQITLAIRLTELAETSKRLAVAREQERATTKERTRLAREIHDTLAQTFSGIIVQLRAMQRYPAEPQETAVRQMHAENALELASSGLAEARRSLASLRARELEGRSLCEALTLIAQSTTKRSGIPVQVDAANDLDFGVENEPELLRIAQESVTNAVKHSGASQIVIALRRDATHYALCVEDNGTGFDPEKSTEGFGLIGMQERADRIAAKISIRTSDAGTAVCVHLERGDQHAS